MFLPFDQPRTEKMTLHRRSKTITVLKNTQKKNNFSLNSKRMYSQKLNSKSLSTIKNHTQTINDPDNTKNFKTLRTMTEQIQRLINRQLCYPQLLTYVQSNSSRFRRNEDEDPEERQFNDDFYQQKTKKNFETCTAGFREPEYLNLLKKTQKLNSKAFVPHFNWKQKLYRMKNLGNYGHLSKKNDKPTEKKLFPKKSIKDERKQYNKDYIVDSTSITIQPQIIISRGMGAEEKINRRRISECRRCQTSVIDISNEKEKRIHQPFFVGERTHSRNFSQTKPNFEGKIIHKRRNAERDWQFQPWDVQKDS